jgi:hypothetical protein
VSEKEPCDAGIRPMRDNTELICELQLPHRDHQAMLKDYAYSGSRTLITWHEDDRRNFHGEWPGPCEDDTCLLPHGHRGAHAT